MNQIRKNCHLTACLQPCLMTKMVQFVNHYSTPLKSGYMIHKMPILLRILAFFRRFGSLFGSILAHIWINFWFRFGSVLSLLWFSYWFSCGSEMRW